MVADAGRGGTVPLDNHDEPGYSADVRTLCCLFGISFVVGCTFDGRGVTSESAVRLPLRDRVVGLVEKQLTGEGWTATVVSRTSDGRISTNVSDFWSEDVYTLDVAAKQTQADDTPILISMNEAVRILETLRKKIRDVVEDNGGEQLDYVINEGFRERSLVFRYKSGGMVGWVQVRVFPKTDRPDENVTRIEITIHELPSST